MNMEYPNQKNFHYKESWPLWWPNG
jgi:hypothetical protein